MEKRPSFFQLPGEIRNEIYWYLLCSNSHPIVFPKPSKSQGCSLVATRRQIHTSIIFTCKTIYNEAVPILYGQNFFWYSVPGGFGAKACRLIPPLSKSHSTTNTLIDYPALTPDIGIPEKLVHLVKYVTIDRICFGSEFSEDDDRFLAELVEPFARPDSRLMHFQLNMRSCYDVWSSGPQILLCQSKIITVLKRIRSAAFLAFLIDGELQCDKGLVDELRAAWKECPYSIYDHGRFTGVHEIKGQTAPVLAALAWLVWGEVGRKGLTESFLFELR